MAAAVPALSTRRRAALARARTGGATRESPAVRRLLIAGALAFLGLFLVVPLVAVFVQAFAKGWGAFAATIAQPETRHAVGLTVLVALVTVPVNVVFGIAAAWLIARFEFPGRSLLVTLIDLPFAVSPVIAGMVFVLVFGARGLFGPWLLAHGLHVIFALPGIVLATTFVTLPFVARELLPLMQEQGAEEEQAAVTLGASPWQTFWRVTLPKVKWGLLYGVVVCNARAMGEFGAVSVVSGHIRGLTNTLPLHVEVLYNEYDFAGAFAAASLLALLAIVTLVAKKLVERRSAAGDGGRR